MKYSKALKALIEKAERDIHKLLTDVNAGKLDQRILEVGLEQVERDLKHISIHDHMPDPGDDPDVDSK